MKNVPRKQKRRRATGGRRTKQNESEFRQRRRREGRRDCERGRADEPARGRAGAGRAREREGGALRRASPSSPLLREGTKVREGVSWTLEQRLRATAPNMPATRRPKDEQVGKGSERATSQILSYSLACSLLRLQPKVRPTPRPRLLLHALAEFAFILFRSANETNE